jgi:hypothetical protein
MLEDDRVPTWIPPSATLDAELVDHHSFDHPAQQAHASTRQDANLPVASL